jgi:hypothetical protein
MSKNAEEKEGSYLGKVDRIASRTKYFVRLTDDFDDRDQRSQKGICTTPPRLISFEVVKRERPTKLTLQNRPLEGVQEI